MLDHTDFDSCYAAVASRDRRFDGRFVTGVLTTGIYCRPSCPARTPLRGNVRFFPTPAAALEAGLRACRRCRPELAPDAADVDPTGDLAARALRLIGEGDGAQDVAGLAARLHVSSRHLHRVLVATYGAGPAALMRMRRVTLSRILVDQTDLPLARVAYASGFGSVRQFNDAFRRTFGSAPSSVRRSGAAAGPGGPDGPPPTTDLVLPVRRPFDGDGVLRWAALHAVTSRDEISSGTWVRHTGWGTVTLQPQPDGIRIHAEVPDLRDVTAAVALARRTFDVDADVDAMATALEDDRLLAPLVRARPGVRIPGAADPFEGAVRVVVGQQVSARAASTMMDRLATLTARPGIPSPDELAGTPLDATIGLTRSRAAAVRALAGAVADGLDLVGGDPADTAVALRALPGIGPWTTACIGLLVQRLPDAWPSGDLALRRAVEDLTGTPTTARELDRMADRWRPWRGYAALLLWHHHLDALDRPSTD